MFSSTVSSMNVPRPSGTCATPRRTTSSVAMPLIASPPRMISPCVRTMPQIARRVVVLPAPLAPRSAVTPPSSTTKSMPCRTFVSPYAACRPLASSNAGMMVLLLRVAEVGADHLRFGAHLIGRAVGDLNAEFQRHDFVGYAHHQVHVVFNQQNADIELLPDAPHQTGEFVDLAVIEATRRFVEHQKFGPRHQRACQLDPLLPAEWNRARQRVGHLTQIEQIEKFV